MAKRGVNLVILVGNLGQDPDMRRMPNGDAVAQITVATSEVWKDQQGQKQERTEWHRCVVYRKLAEIVGQYLKKGAKVYLEGRLRTRKWQDQSGQERYTTEIIVDELQMLDGKPANGQSQPQQQANQGAQQGQSASAGYNQQPEPQWDDDIPFAPIGLPCRALLHVM